MHLSQSPLNEPNLSNISLGKKKEDKLEFLKLEFHYPTLIPP
jgi:hypothetical protein